MLDHYGVLYHDRDSQMVRCPLHEDRTPSCSVVLERGLWNCHSCGKGGDSYALIMEMEGTDFTGARELAASLGLPAGDDGGSDGPVRGSSYAGRRKVSNRSRTRARDDRYVPSWKRG